MQILRAARSMVLAAGLIAGGPATGAATDKSLLGRWWNSTATVAVDVAPCGSLLCGKVIHADKMQQDKARRAGVPQMLGLSVMRNFRAVRPGYWRGTVFVPARNRAFSSTITLLSPQQVKVEGCILGFLCQHEIWRRNR